MNDKKPSTQAMEAARQIRRLDLTVADVMMDLFDESTENRQKCEEIIVRKLAEIIDEQIQPISQAFIRSMEERYFRTNKDTGAHLNTLFVWNLVRKEAGLPAISIDDLPAYCITHKIYHKIQSENGCKRKTKSE